MHYVIYNGVKHNKGYVVQSVVSTVICKAWAFMPWHRCQAQKKGGITCSGCNSVVAYEWQHIELEMEVELALLIGDDGV